MGDLTYLVSTALAVAVIVLVLRYPSGEVPPTGAGTRGGGKWKVQRASFVVLLGVLCVWAATGVMWW